MKEDDTTVGLSPERAGSLGGRALETGIEWWRRGGGVSFFSFDRGSKANSLFSFFSLGKVSTRM